MARSQLDIIINLVEKGTKKNLDGIINSITAMGVALGAVKLAGDAWRAGMEGAALAKAEKAFAGMAKSVGQDIREISEAMIDATDGAVDMQTAMEAASRAIKLGVAKTPEEFARLAEASTKLGAAMGRGPADAINDIVTGIGRMSPLILDNIGIMTNGGQVFDDYAQSIGKTADQLSDAEKKQALLNKAVEDGSKLSAADATGFEKLAAATKNLSDMVKKDLATVLDPFAKLLAELAENTLSYAEAQDYLTERGYTQLEVLRLLNPEGKLYFQTTKMQEEAIIGFVNALKSAPLEEETGRWRSFVAPLEEGAETMKRYELAALDAGTAIEDVTLRALGQKALAALEEAGVGWEGQRVVMEELLGVSPQVLDANEKMQAALAEFGDTGNIDLLVARMKDTETLANDLGEEALPVLRSGMEESGSVPDWIQRSWINWVRTLQKAADASGMDFTQFVTGRRHGFPRVSSGGSTFNPGTGSGGFQEPGGASGANFVVPPGFPADSFPFRASSGERVIIQPASGGQSFFDNSTVNINNGTSMDAFESMLRGLA